MCTDLIEYIYFQQLDFATFGNYCFYLAEI